MEDDTDGLYTFTPTEAEDRGAFDDEAITLDDAGASLVDLEEAMNG